MTEPVPQQQDAVPDGQDAVPDEQTDEQTDEQHVPEPPVTGDEAVDEAVAELARRAGDPLEQQVGAFDRAHRTLQDRLADVDR